MKPAGRSVRCHNYFAVFYFAGFYFLSMQLSPFAGAADTFEHFDISNQEKFWDEPKWKDGHIVSAAKQVPTELKSLVQLDEAIIKGAAAGCISTAKLARARVPDLSGWILKRELQCLESAAKANRAESGLALNRIWKVADDSRLFALGPWVESLKYQWKNTAVAWIDFLRRHNQPNLQTSIEQLLNYSEWLSASDRAYCYGILGDRAFLKQNLDAAKSYLDRSLQLEENAENRAKLSLVEASFSKRAPKDKPVDGEAVLAPVLVTDETVKEKELDLRVANSIKQNDPVTAVQDGIELITQFPNGTRAKSVTDKIYDNYLLVTDKSDSAYEIAHNRVIVAMKRADGPRLQKWAQSMYRAGIYNDAYELSDAALKIAPDETASTKLLWLSGRSAQQSGNGKIAEINFKKIVETNTGSEEFVDALIQLGILNLEKQDWPGATFYLERATLKQRDASKDLTARYWLWRALQRTDAVRAKVIAQQIANRYPLSYYGLRARADLTENELKWPLYPEVTRSAAIYLSSAERKSFARLQELYKVGWFEEAQVEFRLLPEGVQPISRALMVKVASAIFDFPRAITQFNRVIEADPTLAQDSFLKAVYPRTFFPLALQEAQTRKLDPLLVLSLMRQESAFNPRAISSSGAVGLMQMIPPTIKETQQLLKVHALVLPDDMFDPRRNIQFCTFYLARVLSEFNGSVPLALASYNAGPTRLKHWMKVRGAAINMTSDPMSELWMDELPWDETQFYVKAILRNWILYRMLDGGRVDFKSPFWLLPNSPTS